MPNKVDKNQQINFSNSNNHHFNFHNTEDFGTEIYRTSDYDNQPMLITRSQQKSNMSPGPETPSNCFEPRDNHTSTGPPQNLTFSQKNPEFFKNFTEIMRPDYNNNSFGYYGGHNGGYQSNLTVSSGFFQGQNQLNQQHQPKIEQLNTADTNNYSRLLIEYNSSYLLLKSINKSLDDKSKSSSSSLTESINQFIVTIKIVEEAFIEIILDKQYSNGNQLTTVNNQTLSTFNLGLETIKKFDHFQIIKKLSNFYSIFFNLSDLQFSSSSAASKTSILPKKSNSKFKNKLLKNLKFIYSLVKEHHLVGQGLDEMSVKYFIKKLNIYELFWTVLIVLLRQENSEKSKKSKTKITKSTSQIFKYILLIFKNLSINDLQVKTIILSLPSLDEIFGVFLGESGSLREIIVDFLENLCLGVQERCLGAGVFR